MSAIAVRDRVLGFVSRYPGVHLRVVERELGLSDRLAAHHLDSLADEGLVRRLDDGGFARYVAAERADRLTRRERAFLALMRRPPALQIMVLLLAVDELPHREIAARLGLAKASTSYHLRALEGARIVDARDEGRQRHYSLADPTSTRDAIAEFGAIPGDLDEFSLMWDDLLSR